MFAGRRLRNAERLQKDSYLARLESLAHIVVAEQPQNTNIEVPVMRKIESLPSREAIIRHIRNTNKQIDDSLIVLVKELVELKSLSLTQARRLRRFMDYRIRNADYIALRYMRSASTEELNESSESDDGPSRYVVSEMPADLSEVFTNESSGSERYWMEIDEEEQYMREVAEADPNDLIGFKPFEPKQRHPNSPVRPVASVLAWQKHDVSSLMQDSTIFRAYGEGEFDGDQQTEKAFSREEERKMIEALTTDL